MALYNVLIIEDDRYAVRCAPGHCWPFIHFLSWCQNWMESTTKWRYAVLDTQEMKMSRYTDHCSSALGPLMIL